MTPPKKYNTREERLLDLIQRISTAAAEHMIAVTEAIGELRSYIDGKMNDMQIAAVENKSRCDVLNEKLDNIAEETSATKNAINQLANEIVELEKCTAAVKAIEESKKFDWKTKWWQSKEFFLILIIIMLLILLGSHSGVNIVDEIGRLLKSITGIFGKG